MGKTILRILIQTALVLPATCCLPLLFVLVVGVTEGFQDGSASDAIGLSIFIVCSFSGLLALLASIFCPKKWLARGKFSGLVLIGLFAALAASLLYIWYAFFAPLSLLEFGENSSPILLWLFIGPAVAAVWNLIRIFTLRKEVAKVSPPADEAKAEA